MSGQVADAHAAAISEIAGYADLVLNGGAEPGMCPPMFFVLVIGDFDREEEGGDGPVSYVANLKPGALATRLEETAARIRTRIDAEGNWAR